MPPLAYIPSVLGTLGDTGVCRRLSCDVGSICMQLLRAVVTQYVVLEFAWETENNFTPSVQFQRHY